MADVEFNDYSINVKDVLKEKGALFLEEACAEVESATKRNSRVKTGQTKGSFEHYVDSSELVGYIGSSYQNAIWEEFGTGIHSITGNGRKDVPWVYYDETGKRHVTSGKKPSRAFWNAYCSLKNSIIDECKRRFGDLG